MPSRDRDRERRRLRVLDRCLHELEDANERDQVTVPATVAARVRAHVPAVREGMVICDAINLVLHEQEQYVGRVVVNGELVPGLDDDEAPLPETAARELTERIKRATREVCMLLFEAHRRRAWQALGYPTWDRYVADEFSLSRSRAYELLDQGRVIRAVIAAAGISGIPDISAYAAEQIKPYLPEVIESVRARTHGQSEPDALLTVLQVVHEQRVVIAIERQRHELNVRQGAATDLPLARLREAIECLASMPPVPDVLREVDGNEARRLARLDHALRWLEEFAAEWRKQHRLSLPYAAPAPRALAAPASRSPASISS